MKQLTLFQDPVLGEDEWPETCIVISLMPRYYHPLVIAQTKKYEYRRGGFINFPVTAFVYSSMPKGKEDIGLPSAEIGGVVKLGNPIIGIDDVLRLWESEKSGSQDEMASWLSGFKTASAHPVERVSHFTDPVSLSELRNKFVNFQPPQRYLLLDNNPKLLNFLKQRSGIFSR